MFKFFLSIISVFVVTINVVGQTDICFSLKQKLAAINEFINDSIFIKTVSAVKDAALKDSKEHCVSFGYDSTFGYTSSMITNGSNTSGQVPFLKNAFCDIHNHNNNLPPDAGDVYGLISKCKKEPNYYTRFIVTANGTVYLLLVVDLEAAIGFSQHYPAQQPAAVGLQPTFPEKIVDKCRELKYNQHFTDGQIICYILKKFNVGLLLTMLTTNGKIAGSFCNL